MAYDRSDPRPVFGSALGIVDDPNGIIDQIKRLDPCCLDDLWIGIASVVVKKPTAMRLSLAMIQKVPIATMGALPRNRFDPCHRWSNSEIAVPR